MKAIVSDGSGAAAGLHLAEVPDLAPGPGELLVRVRATAANRADILQHQGRYPPPPGASAILGLEMAGEVLAAGADVAGWRPGDRVCALLAGGGYAEQAVIPADLALAIPANLSFEEAAAIPEAWLTAYDNLFNWGALAAGETVLLHGGASGVGTAAIQLARRRGARVLATAGSAAKIARCLELGAAAGINYHTEDWPARVLALTGGDGANVILDIIGAAYLDGNLRSLAAGGRLVVIGLMGGAKAELNLGLLLSKRLSLIGTTLRARPLSAKVALTRQFAAEIWPAFAAGDLRPVIDRVLPLAAAAEAHAAMQASDHIGKIVLQVP